MLPFNLGSKTTSLLKQKSLSMDLKYDLTFAIHSIYGSATVPPILDIWLSLKVQFYWHFCVYDRASKPLRFFPPLTLVLSRKAKDLNLSN